MRIRPPDLTDDAQTRRFHEIVWRAEKEDGRPWNPMWTFAELASILRDPISERRTVGLAAFDDDDDRMVGAGFLMMSMLDNLDTAFVFVGVEPELRGRGIGSVLLDEVVALARTEGRTQLLGGAGVPFEDRETSPVVAWCARNGFSVAQVEIQRNLALPVPTERLDEIATEAATRHHEYDVQTFVGPVPDELLPSWCELSNTFLLEAPMGEVDVEAGAITPAAVREKDAASEKMGRTVFATVAVRDGRVVAHSDIGVSADGDEAHQWGTLVHRDHRGHRLGAAVKVANLRALQARLPGVTHVVTCNAEDNPWMVAINDRLGFEPVAVVPTFQRKL